MKKIEDKVLDYLKEHKKPATIKQLARYYIVSENSVQRALADLASRNIVQIVPKSKPYLYRIV
jgi:Mn-dependent DtxR family transcriptional regulator